MNRGIFEGRCYLCGDPIRKGLFCVAHLWAEDSELLGIGAPVEQLDENLLALERELGRAEGLAERPPFTLTRAHGYWLENYSPKKIRRLGLGLAERVNGHDPLERAH